MQTIDGVSFVPYLKHTAKIDSSRALVWHYPNRWTVDETNAFCYASAIRLGDWKLVYLMKQQRMELYNLKDDLGEQHDLAKRYPLKLAELASLLTRQLKEYDAQMPAYKSSGEAVAWPDEIKL